MKVTETLNNFAISSDGIATALQDSASSLVAANNSYEQAVALIASANRVVQDPNSVGAALRTISLRLRGTSATELEEAGEDTDGAIESKSKLQSKIKGLSGVDILTDTGAYKSTYDILLEISKVWKDMSDIDQAALLEIIAGKTRSNTAAAILSNTKDLEEAYVQALKAEGSALQENEKYLDSIQGRIDLFNNSVQTMWQNTLDSDAVKLIVDAGTGLIKIIDSLGLVKTLILAIGTYLIQKHFKGDLVGGLFGDSTSIESIKKQITDLEATYDRTKAKFQASPTDKNRKSMEDAEKNLNTFKETNKETLDIDEKRSALNDKLEALKAEREKLQEDLKVAQDHLVDVTTNGVQEDVRDFVEIDTSHIDDQIASVQEKLDVARQQLADAKSAKWDDYKALGSLTPAKDRDSRIDLKKQEIKELETDLGKLQNQKDEFMSSEIDNVVTEGAQAQIEELTSKIGNTDEAIQETKVELQGVEAQLGATGNTGLLSFQKIKAGAISAGKAVLTFGKELAKSMATMYAITTVLDLLGDLGGLVIDFFSGSSDAFEKADEKFEEANNELSNIKSELSSLESELKKTNDRIEELQQQETLSFVEQEELDNLKSVSQELERQIELNNTLKKQQQQATNDAAFHAVNTYMSSTSFYSDKSKSERQEEAKETGDTIGSTAGLAFGAAVGSLIPGVGTLIGAGIGSAIGGWIGGAIGSAGAGSSYDSEMSVGEAIDRMSSLRAGMKADIDKARDAINNSTEATQDQKDALTSAEQKLADFDATMAQSMSQIQQYLNAVDYSSLDKDGKQEYRDRMDELLKYNIEYGVSGAKESAVKTIFNEDMITDEAQELKDSIVAMLDVSEDVDFMDFDDERFASIKDRLLDIGLTVTDVIAYFRELKVVEEESSNYETYDMVKEVAKFADSIGELKGAFDEFNESGYVTAQTLMKLNEVFGDITGWKKYIDVMSTGTASTEAAIEATNQLAENLLKDMISSNPFDMDSTDGFKAYLTAIQQLQSIGVTNANELVDAMQQKSLVNKVVSQMAQDAKTIDELEKKTFRSKDEQKKLDSLKKKTQNDYIKAVEEEYGIQIKNTDLIEKQVELNNAKDNSADYADYQNEYFKSGSSYLEEYNSSLEKTKKLEKEANTLQSKIDELTEDGYSSIWDGYKESNGNYLEQVWETLKYITLDDNTKYHQYDNTEDELSAKNDEIAEEVKERKELFNDLIELAKDLNIDLKDIDTKKFDASSTDNTIFKAVYNRIKKFVTDNKGKFDKLSEEAQDAIEKALNELGFEIDLELKDPSEELDKIQDIYNTLNSAAEEYRDNNGFVSVDTMQELLALEPKYLAMLTDENGKLKLNQDAILQVTQARLFDLTQKQIDSVITNATTAAKDGEIEKLKELTDVLYEAAGAQHAFNTASLAVLKTELADKDLGLSKKEQDEYYGAIEDQVNSIISTYNSTVANLPITIGSGGGNSSGGGSGDTALERVQNAYESKIDNLDNQQKYIQNEIDRLEAEGETVSKSYYEKQIELEQDKLALYRQQREELFALERTDDVAAALWDVEHAIQESTLRMVELRQSIIDLYVTAFDNIISASDNKDDFLTDQQDYIDKYQELMELQGKTPTAFGIQEQIAIEEEKLGDNISELNALRNSLDEGMLHGNLEEGSEEWIKMQDEIRATEAAILDNQIAIEQYREELKRLSVDAFELVRGSFSNKDNFLTNQQEYIQGYADLLEAQGIDIPTKLYEELSSIEQQKRENNVANLIDARQGFTDIEAAGYTAADEEWQDAYQQVVDLEKAVQDNDIAMAEYAQTIRDLDFEKFDRFISRLDDINSEIDNLRKLFDDEDVAFEDGTWTEDGITSLGLLYHQMELAEQKSNEYSQKISDLNEEYNQGKMYEQEYYERLQELKDGQWDAIDAYESAKDAIVDMEEARIDMIEEGINEEIEAYQELIDVKKEELDAERDLYDFKKKVKDQTKEISSLERRIASLSGSTDASDIAERRKLEAQLRESQEGLNDTYYSHAKDQQSQALDNEMTSFREAKEEYLETLRDTLEDTSTLINTKIAEVLSNADIVTDTINQTAAERGVTLSDSLTLPWENAKATATSFKATLDETLPLLTNEDGVITVFGITVTTTLENAFGSGSTACTAFKSTVEANIGAIKTVVCNSTSELTSNLKLPWNSVIKEDGPVNTFSTQAKNAIQNAVTTAKNNASAMKSNLSSPWSTQALNTWSSSVKDVLNKAVNDAYSASLKIKDYLDVGTKSYVGSGSTNSNGSANAGGYISSGDQRYSVNAKLTTSVGTFTGKGIAADRNMALQHARTDVLNNAYAYYQDHGYNDAWIDKQYDNWYNKVTFYANGTMGTKQGQWAITDEPWLGDELTMYATPEGKLSYMRAGSTVVPADITKNLVEWGKLNPNMMDMSSAIQGVNLMSNYVNKPEIKLDVENFLRVDRVDKDTLPELEKLMDKKIDNFARQLNYSLKKFGAK